MEGTESLVFSKYFMMPLSESLGWAAALCCSRGVKLIFAGGHISLTVAFKGPNIILGLYKCNHSTVKQELGAVAG